MVYGKRNYYLREKDILWNEQYFVENKTDSEACLKNAVNFYNMNFRDFLHGFEYMNAALLKVKIEG